MTTLSRFWKSPLKYMLTVEIKRAGTVGDPRANKVIGRVLGERTDGQLFFATVDLPWIWPGPDNWDWRAVAMWRLDTFLLDWCKCEARDTQQRVCEEHVKLFGQWCRDDAELNRMFEQGSGADLPAVTSPGPLPVLEMIHSDFPWCRYDRKANEWVCNLCGFRQAAMDNNSTWRNQFIRKHGDCGLPANDRSGIKTSIEEQVLNELGERLEELYANTGAYWADTARAFILNQRGKLVIDSAELQAPERRLHKLQDALRAILAAEGTIDWIMGGELKHKIEKALDAAH